MFVVDDPVLALIVRFVVGAREMKLADEQFLQRQVNTLKQYLRRFPGPDQEAKAIEWIARHAEQYRAQWQSQEVENQVQQVRCIDCPMNALGEDEYCAVHFKWLELLNRYSRNELTSIEYVKSSLNVLQAHKSELIVRKSQEAQELQQLKAFRAGRNKRL